MIRQIDWREFNSKVELLRSTCLRIAVAGGDNAAHIGGALSCIDFIAIADSIYNFSSNAKSMQSLILSKGHACLAIYALLATSKITTIDEIIESFEKNGSRFLGHPCKHQDLGIMYSTGSLGNGLAYAVGQALHESKFKKDEASKTPIVCIIGDGECNEGIVWETMEFISKLKLDNLIIFVDCNGWQQTQRCLYFKDDYKLLHMRFNTFNIDSYLIDGHDYDQINSVLNITSNKTKVILGKTIKGKGYELFENNNEWHHGILTKQHFDEIHSN